MKPFRELLLAHTGRAAIITGGSGALPSDVERAASVYSDAVVISSNQHGCLLGRKVDYICCYDNIHGILQETASKHSLAGYPPIITYRDIPGHEVYRLLEYPVWPLTGQLACWIAYTLGCCPIILTGMGCYQKSESIYFHNPNLATEGWRVPLDTHLADWQRVKDALAGARIRVVSGPLVGMFPELDPNEDFSDYQVPDRLALLKEHSGKVVKIIRPCRVAEDCFEPDMIVELPRKDAQNLFDRRRAVPARVSVN